MGRFLLALAAMALGLAVGTQETISAPGTTSHDTPTPKVKETFQVGANTYVRSLLADGNTLWVGTSTGVLEIDLTSREPRNIFTREHGLASEYVFAIGRDRDGYIWFGTNAGGVSRYRDGDWRVFFPMHGLADYWVYAFAQRRAGDFWIGTWAGANRVELDKLQFITYQDELINEWVYGIAVDSKDRVWFGTEGGLSRFDGEEWVHWTHADGLGAANKANLPHSTNTGLGTRARHDLSVLVDGRESYNPNYVFAVYIDAKDTVWVGTWGAGLARFDGVSWRNFTVADGLAGNIVYSIAQDPHGMLWFGTNHGLSRFDGETWINYGHVQGLPVNDDVYAIAARHDGEVWIGVKGAVVNLGYSQ